MSVPIYRRAQVGVLVERMQEPPGPIQILFGPRQSGKTTIARQAMESLPQPARYWSAEDFRAAAPDEPIDRLWLGRRWLEAREIANRAGGGRGAVAVFDEIHRIPQWATTVKGLWDEDRRLEIPLRVVILGSAPFAVQRGLTEGMTGRFEVISVPHWSFPEMEEAFGFDLPQFLFFGGFPGAAGLIGDRERWAEAIRRAYIEPTIQRDLIAMARIEKHSVLADLLHLGSRYSGQIASYTKLKQLISEVGNTTTLARHLDLLRDVGAVAGLPKHPHRPLRRRSSPKLIAQNTALMSVASRLTLAEAQRDRAYWGRVVETAVGAHLFRLGRTAYELRYWRHQGHEVDFVVERGPHLVGIEVKSGSRPQAARGFPAFRSHFPRARTLLVGAGGVPLPEFLSRPGEYWVERGGR